MNIREERLVAKLEMLGVRYLSRQAVLRAGPVRSPARFLADLIRQPSSRVRTAFIAVVLAQPDLARVVPEALERLKPEEQLTLKLFFTAAVFLAQEHSVRLEQYVGDRWQRLADLYSGELGLATPQPRAELLHPWAQSTASKPAVC